MTMTPLRHARLAAASLALVAVAAAPAAAGVKKGDRAADFVQVLDAAGKAVSLRSLADSVVVVTFGASWCGPCKKELPALEKLAERYQQKKAKVVFVAVNVDSDLGKGKQFVQNAGLKAVRAVFDTNNSTVEAYDPPKMPSVYIIRRGVVRDLHTGYESGDEGAIAKAVDRELLAK